jgi:hypothetical protein
MSDQPLRYGSDRKPDAIHFKKRRHHPTTENKDKLTPKPSRKAEDPWRSKKQQFRNVNVDDLDDYLLDNEA